MFIAALCRLALHDTQSSVGLLTFIAMLHRAPCGTYLSRNTTIKTGCRESKVLSRTRRFNTFYSIFTPF